MTLQRTGPCSPASHRLHQAGPHARLGFRILRIFSLALLLATLPGSPPRSYAQGKGEYEVKAYFLFHFAQFVEWPPDAFKDASTPLTFCTIGDDPFDGAFEQVIKGKSITTHPLEVQHLKARDQIAACQVLFIGSSEKKHLGEDLASAAGHPILTVGETDNFAQNGGVIGFLMENEKVRFEINLQSAAKANLKISSRLLILAKDVIGKVP